LDPNTLLLWLVSINAAAGLLVQWHRFRTRHLGWVTVHLLVLVVVILAASVVPDHAGYVGLAVWFPLIGLPALLLQSLTRLLLGRRFRAAKTVARTIALLHPADGLREYPQYIAVLAQIHTGDVEGARRRLRDLPDPNSAVARFARLHLLRHEGRYEDLVRLVEEEHEPGAAPNAEMLLHYLRALGETGRIESMMRSWDSLGCRSPTGMVAAVAQLYVAAFTGRFALVEKLVVGPFRKWPAEIGEYWIATAQQVAGRSPEASGAFERLARSPSPEIRAGSERRLEHPLPELRAEELPEESRRLLVRFEESVRLELRYQTAGVNAGQPRLITPALMLANVGVFLLELPGGATDLDNLVRFGALVAPLSLVDDQWWRILTAGFLHFGYLHLVLNVLGIWILGSFMERVWGRARLVVCYLAAMIGANALAILVVRATADAPVVMLGASGGVMGILGASIAFALVAWRRHRPAVLRRQLLLFGAILVLQTLFDLVTPEVSSTLHLAGLVTGAVTAVLFSVLSRAEAEA